MAYDDKVVMAESLDDAFSKLFGNALVSDDKEEAELKGEDENEEKQEETQSETQAPFEDLTEARIVYSEVKAAFEAGDWVLFGEKMKELDAVLGNE